MKIKNVIKTFPADLVDMGGLPVRQPIPTQNTEQIDPFLLLHHAKITLPKHGIPHKMGVGPHPHRGFSPVTFVLKGGVQHRDSFGNKKDIYAGGVQWMNAGKGIVHSERPPKNIYEIAGEQEIIQLWINTPKANKMDIPFYKGLSKEDIPVVKFADGNSYAQLIAGNYHEQRGVISPNSPMLIMKFEVYPDAEIKINIPSGFNSCFYQIDGELNINGFGKTEGLNLYQFSDEGDFLTLKAFEKTQFLLLAGKPINEPLATYGPFVMNNQTEIMEAMRDYNMGKMGILIEDE
jgi:quercetin 2,3-dioxygenase